MAPQLHRRYFLYGAQEGLPRGVRDDDLARSDGALRALRIETSPRRAEPSKAEQRVSARVSARVAIHRPRCPTLEKTALDRPAFVSNSLDSSVALRPEFRPAFTNRYFRMARAAASRDRFNFSILFFPQLQGPFSKKISEMSELLFIMFASHVRVAMPQCLSLCTFVSVWRRPATYP